MNAQGVKIRSGSWLGPARILGRVRVSWSDPGLVNGLPEHSEMESALQEKALAMGANAVLHAAYDLSISPIGRLFLGFGGTAAVTQLPVNGPIENDFRSWRNCFAQMLDDKIITFEFYAERMADLRDWECARCPNESEFRFWQWLYRDLCAYGLITKPEYVVHERRLWDKKLEGKSS